MSAPVRVPRGRRTAVSVVVAVVATLAAAATGYVAVLKALRRNLNGVDLSGTVDGLRATAWSASGVLVAGIVTAAVGLLLLAVAVVPSRRRLVELTDGDGRTATGLKRRSLRRTVVASAVHIDGISAATARIGRRRIQLSLTSGLHHVDGLSEAARAAVSHRLDVLQLRRPRTVAARLTTRER